MARGSHHGQPVVVVVRGCLLFCFVASCCIAFTRGIWHGSAMLDIFGPL